MPTWKQAFREGLVSGSLASAFSAAYLAWAGHRRGQPAAPVNAVSHWFFGDRALRQDQASLLYTLTGYLTHHAASIFWGVLYAKAWGAREEAKEPLPAVAGAVTLATVAAIVDYQLTPKRLTPGFEHRLGRPEMSNVYAFFALGIAVGTLVMKARR
ncbi:hypothetical protein [Ramlibacter sp. AN1133]|uniref:hypothetical protein n=1 Tax=Ramlibacter sp. AN1133 TaxID=3133429 RepID=UPI0030BAEF3E